MAIGIRQMPCEILRLIVENLAPDDVFNLAICGSHFHYVIRDQGICRIALRNVRFSPEYKDASVTGDFAKGLRTYVKRRDAIRAANPFQALQIARNVIHFLYVNDTLCYTTKEHAKHQLRILRLYGSVSRELVIDVPLLLRISSIPDYVEGRKYEFKPLYYAHGILSCLFSQSKRYGSNNQLLICDLQRMKILSVHCVSSKTDIFVRNNHAFLYYGTRSESSEDGEKCWVLRGFSFDSNDWLAHRLVLWDLIGAEVGSTTCFEIFGDFLYGLSSQDYLDSGEIGLDSLDSYYYAFRFRLGDHKTQVFPKSALWRRTATEGPIDDRWSCLELAEDEASGKIFISETRREWLSTNSQSQRTCYRKELIFPANSTYIEDDLKSFESGAQGEANTNHSQDREEHHGDGGSSPTPFTFYDSPVRSFHVPSRAFVDIVRCSAASNSTAKRLRLRVRRQLSNPESSYSPAIESCETKCATSPPDDEIKLWPPERDSAMPNPALDRLYQILNPLVSFDVADWAVDKRLLVYLAKNLNDNDGELSPLVLISFDPSLRLDQLQEWYSNSTTCRRKSQQHDMSISAETTELEHCTTCFCDPRGLAREGASIPDTSKAKTRDMSIGVATNKHLANYIEESNELFFHGFDFSLCRSPDFRNFP